MNNAPISPASTVERRRLVKVIRGILAAVAVPFVVTGIYRLSHHLVSDSNAGLLIWLSTPFILVLAGALWIARSRKTWRDIAAGLAMGAVVYALALAFILWQFGRTQLD